MQHGKEGKEGQCDARCYNAKTPTCICCCSGKNHGVGLKQALQNTQQMTEELLKKTGVTVSDLEKIQKTLNPGQSRDSKGRFIKK